MNQLLMTARLGAPLAARVASLVLIVAAASCGADGSGAVTDCSFGACAPIDASVDGGGGARSDASSLPPADAGAADGSEIGSRRSPLCAVSGCFPGNAQACVSAPPTDGGGDEVLEEDLADGGNAGDANDDDAEDAAAPVAPDAGAPASDAGLVVFNDAPAPSDL